jgi:hypothetical protein
LQDSIRDAIIAARDTAAADTFADIAEVTEADTIYRIDKISEEAIFAWFNANWPAQSPVQLVMEALRRRRRHLSRRHIHRIDVVEVHP